MPHSIHFSSVLSTNSCYPSPEREATNQVKSQAWGNRSNHQLFAITTLKSATEGVIQADLLPGHVCLHTLLLVLILVEHLTLPRGGRKHSHRAAVRREIKCKHCYNIETKEQIDNTQSLIHFWRINWFWKLVKQEKIFHLPRWAQRPRWAPQMSRAAGSQDFLQVSLREGPQTWTIVHCFSQAMSRKWSNPDRTQMRCRQFYLLYHLPCDAVITLLVIKTYTQGRNMMV